MRRLQLGLLSATVVAGIGLILPTGHEVGVGVPAPRTNMTAANSSRLPSPTDIMAAAEMSAAKATSAGSSRSRSTAAVTSRMSRSATATRATGTGQAATTTQATETGQTATTGRQTATRATTTTPVSRNSGNRTGNAPAAAPNATGAAAPLPGNWRMTFSEDFNADLDPNVWAKLRGSGDGTYAAPYSVEYDAYAYKASYTTVEDGNLRLRWAPDPVSDGGHDFPYTAAVATTANGYHFKYGIVEARIWLPAQGNGLWPCFWLLPYPVDSTWPPEIDVAEFDYANTVTGHGNLHYISNGQHKDIPGFPPYAPNVGGSWHTYGVRWAADRLEFMLDGKVAYTYTGEGIPNQEMYIVFSTGILKGHNPGHGHMLVDYIRVWQES